jgi:hypothetical protein
LHILQERNRELGTGRNASQVRRGKGGKRIGKIQYFQRVQSDRDIDETLPEFSRKNVYYNTVRRKWGGGGGRKRKGLHILQENLNKNTEMEFFFGKRH